MCQGRGHAEGGCDCPAGKTERFLQPSLLLALHLQPSYGYELIEKVRAYAYWKRMGISEMVNIALKDFFGDLRVKKIQRQELDVPRQKDGEILKGSSQE